VEISLRLIDERAVEIQVKDTGAGMSKQELSKIFKSFSRGLAGQQFHSAGAGLGLYIAKRFVQLHQGRIWATSPGKDKGSTMWVELLLKLDQAKLKKDLKSFSTGGGEKIPW
jgi:signal transduction histidine kinase